MTTSLTQMLSNGKSALFANQRALANAANNSANVATDGFNRRDPHFSSRAYEHGVDLELSRRDTAQYLTNQIIDQSSDLGATNAQTSALATVDRLFRAGEGSIGNAVDRFFNAIRNLALTPADLDRRQETLSSAQEMTQTISGTAKRMEQERRAIDQSLEGLTQEVNAIAEKLATLNFDLSKTPELDAKNGAILDKQGMLVKQLAELVPIHAFRDEQNHLTVLFNGAQTLVTKRSHASLVVNPDPSRANMRSVEIVGVSGIATDVTDKLRTGKMGGLLKLRDESLTEVISRLDHLAFDMSTQFNAVHQNGFGQDGVTGRSFFSEPPASVEGAASVMDLHVDVLDTPDAIAAASDAATAVGGNTHLVQLQALEDQELASSGSRTFSHEIADLVGFVGRTVKLNEEKLQRAQVARQTAINMEQAQVGVALDEEMIDLMRFQRAYQASSKVITTVDQLYEIVMQLK